MRYPFLAMLLCFVVTGCANENEGAVAPLETRIIDEQKDTTGNPGLFMAYERSIVLDVEESRVAAILRSAEDACRQAVDEQCVILESHLDTGRSAYATIKVRAKPEGIKKLIASLSTQGKVISQSVTAEDLAGPIGDAAKRLEMLSDYRSKLESLRSQASGNIDALIKVNKELAEVQSEIEALSGEKSHLLQRVETEILTVTVRSQNERAFWRPIGDAMTDFGTNLSDGISSAITAIAFLLPWFAMLALVGWGGRKLWSRRKRAGGSA